MMRSVRSATRFVTKSPSVVGVPARGFVFAQQPTGTLPRKFPWRQKGYLRNYLFSFGLSPDGRQLERLKIGGGQTFFEKYRYFSHSHDGSADASMWDYKLVPVTRMVTRKHARRLHPSDYQLYGGTQKKLQTPPNFFRLQFFFVSLFFAVWQIVAWEFADMLGHWDIHDFADGVSVHPRVTRADMISEEEFFHPALKGAKWEGVYNGEPSNIYNKETERNFGWQADSNQRANSFPHHMGRPVFLRTLQQNTKWGPMIPDAD